MTHILTQKSLYIGKRVPHVFWDMYNAYIYKELVEMTKSRKLPKLSVYSIFFALHIFGKIACPPACQKYRGSTALLKVVGEVTSTLIKNKFSMTLNRLIVSAKFSQL